MLPAMSNPAAEYCNVIAVWRCPCRSTRIEAQTLGEHPARMAPPRCPWCQKAAAYAPDESGPALQRWLTTKELGELLGNIPVATIRGWRMAGIGPPHVKLGALVRYERSAVEGWLAAGGERRSEPTVNDRGRSPPSIARRRRIAARRS